MAIVGVCEKCGEPVRKDQAAFPVTGWEVIRADGGANAIRNRERIGNRVRHSTCLPPTNVHEAQEALSV